MGLSRWFRRYDIDRLDQRDPEWIDTLYRVFHAPFERYFRAQVRGLDRIPDGAALYVGNHNAIWMIPDSFLFGFAVYRERGIRDVPYGLGHEFMIRFPLVNPLIVPAGAVRAGHGLAHRLLARGDKVIVYPGSDYDSCRSWRDRDRIRFGGRRGYIRLALAAGVPVVPVVAAGAHQTVMVLTDGQPIARALRMDRWLRLKVWPISIGLPWGLMLGPWPFWPWPSRILIEALAPIRFDRTGEEAAADEAYVDACAKRVEDAMQACLTRLAAERRSRAAEPTASSGPPPSPR